MDARRLAGRLLVAGGLVVTGWAAADWGRGALARDRARALWEAREARMAVDAVQRLEVGGPDAEAPDVARPAGTPVARLRIPRLGLDEVVVAGVDEAALRAGPGHVPGTPLPGASGNAVVSAHRDRHFRTLGGVQVGDTIVTETAHRRVTWVVRERQVVHRDARVLFQGPTPELTLTTCWPIRWFGAAPDRLILTAEPVARLATAAR